MDVAVININHMKSSGQLNSCVKFKYKDEYLCILPRKINSSYTQVSWIYLVLFLVCYFLN